MVTTTPKLGLPRPEGHDNVTRENHVALIDAIDENAASQSEMDTVRDIAEQVQQTADELRQKLNSHGPEHNHDGADPIPDLVQLRDDFNVLTATGVIVESGENANGRYVRFADGTQICYATITDSGEPYLTVSAEQQGASGDYQALYEWTFPANFPSSVGRVRAFATGDIRQGETSRNTIQSFVAGGGSGPTSGIIRIWCREPFNRIYNFTLFAIGRWR